MRWLWIALVVVRLVAATILAFGPATDSADELEGWDAERFHTIVATPGRPWIDHAVEYPPGTVLVAMAVVAGATERDGVVATNRRLIAASLVVDLALAALITVRASPVSGLSYLAIGTLMLPMGLLRLDLWAALAATAALLHLHRDHLRSDPSQGDRSRGRAVWSFAVFMTLGWFIKVFPAVLIAVAVATRSWRAAAAGVVVSAIAGGGWVVYGGFDAIEQMLSLRDVSGWHLESVAGSIVALTTDAVPRLEADAFRIGTIDDRLVLGGRVGFGSAVIGLGALAWRTPRPHRPEAATLMTLGSIAALIVTAPLLSPQFLLWLSPFAALLVGSRSDLARPEVATTAAAMAVTSMTLAVFGPPDLDHPLAAALLLGRDALLVGVVIASGYRLRQLATTDVASVLARQA